MLTELAEAKGVTSSDFIRLLIRERYLAKFGTAVPRLRPKPTK